MMLELKVCLSSSVQYGNGKELVCDQLATMNSVYNSLWPSISDPDSDNHEYPGVK